MATSVLSGAQRAIPATSRWALVLASTRSQSPDAPEALLQLCYSFWKPLFGYLRHQGYSVVDAQELLQEFFGHLVGKRSIAPAERPAGRFRVYLLSSLRNFLSTADLRAAAGLRNGQAETLVPLDARSIDDLERQSFQSASSPIEAFDASWSRVVFERALERLHTEAEVRGRRDLLDELAVFLIGEFPESEKEKLAAMAIRLGVSVPRVKISISRLRQRFHGYLREEVGGTVAQPHEIEDELQHLRRMRDRNGAA